MRPLVTALVMLRVMVAALVLMVVVGINFTWVFTVPACLTSGRGTPGEDDKGALGCWWNTVNKEQVRQQAFEEWARESERPSELDRERREREDERQRELERSARKHHW
jgi:hypothetical protein